PPLRSGRPGPLPGTLPRALEGGSRPNRQRNLDLSYRESSGDRALQPATQGRPIGDSRRCGGLGTEGSHRPGKSSSRAHARGQAAPFSPEVLPAALSGGLHAKRIDAKSQPHPRIGSGTRKGMSPKTSRTRPLNPAVGASELEKHWGIFPRNDVSYRPSAAMILATRSANAPMVREGLTPRASGMIAASAT